MLPRHLYYYGVFVGEIGDWQGDLQIPNAPIMANQQTIEHLQNQRNDELIKNGYLSAHHLLADVVQNYNEVYTGKGNSYILVKRLYKTSIVFITLRHEIKDMYYTINSGLVSRKNYPASGGRKLIWKKRLSEGSASPAANTDPLGPSFQMPTNSKIGQQAPSADDESLF